MDAFLPGVAGWEPIYNNPGIWHFRFYGPTPEALVKGRERTFFEHFWNDFAADKTRSIPEADRRRTHRPTRAGTDGGGFRVLRFVSEDGDRFRRAGEDRAAVPGALDRR